MVRAWIYAGTAELGTMCVAAERHGSANIRKLIDLCEWPKLPDPLPSTPV